MKKPARILVVTSTFPRWHKDTEPAFVYDLCLRLRQKGFDIDVLAPATQDALPYENMDGLNVHRYSYFLTAWEKLAYTGGILANLKKNRLLYFVVPFFMFFQAYAVFFQLRKKKYDIIHAHWIIPQGFICALISVVLGKKAPPILCTSHGGDLFALQTSPLLKIKQWTLNKVQQIAVVSEYMRSRCIDLSVDPKKISVCSMGVDLKDMFKPSEAIERRDERLLFVGRLVEKKGVTFLLEAMKILVDEFPDIELVIVGDGPEQGRLEKKILELGISKHVKFYGSVSQGQLPKIYSSSAIVVVPSIIDHHDDQEGLGLVTIEAMGCGCVVVASSLGAIKEVVDNGKTGLLVSPGKPDEMANAIARLLKDKLRMADLAAKGRQAVIKRYDWEAANERYHKLLLRMIDGGAKA